MGQVADCRSDKVVLLVVQQDGDSPKGFYKLLEPPHSPRACFRRRGDDIIDILQKVRGSVGIAAFFRSGHRVPADKIRGQRRIGNFLMDGRFYAAHVGDYAVLPCKPRQFFQKILIVLHWGTEENILASCKIIRKLPIGGVNGMFFHGKGQGITVYVICKQCDAWMEPADGFGDGAAD